jgi:hypothetical protein
MSFGGMLSARLPIIRFDMCCKVYDPALPSMVEMPRYKDPSMSSSDSGCTCFFVRESSSKHLISSSERPNVKWHCQGHLMSNKAMARTLRRDDSVAQR